MILKKQLQCNADPADKVEGGGGASSPSNGTIVQSNAGTLSVDNAETASADEAAVIDSDPSPLQIKPQLAPKTNIVEKTDKVEPIGENDDLFDDGVVTQARIDKTKAKEEATSKEAKNKVVAAEIIKKVDELDAKQQLPAQRDYTQFKDETILPILKKLGNKEFAVYEALHKAHADLNTKYEEASKGIVKLPDSYLEHPEAWQFDPAATRYANAIQQVSSSERHYTEQLIKIENGEAWQDITGYDEKTGEAILSEPIAVKDTTAADKIEIGKKIHNAGRYSSEFRQKLNGLRDTYKTKRNSIEAGIKDHTTKAFPWLTDDKAQSETKVTIIRTDGKEHQTTLKEVIDGFRKLIPAELGNSPLKEPLVGALAALTLSQELVRMNNGKTKVQQQLKADEEAAEPQLNGKTTTAAKRSDKAELVGSIDDLARDE